MQKKDSKNSGACQERRCKERRRKERANKARVEGAEVKRRIGVKTEKVKGKGRRIEKEGGVKVALKGKSRTGEKR